MGLFDEFVTEGLGVACPKCGAELVSLQSKSLPDPVLTQYRMGDVLQMETLEGLAQLEIREGKLVGYTSCDACGAWSDWYLIVKDNRWAAIELANWRDSRTGPAPAPTPTE